MANKTLSYTTEQVDEILKDCILDCNVRYPEAGIDSLILAINNIEDIYQTDNRMVTFNDETGRPNWWKFLGGDWTDINNWVSVIMGEPGPAGADGEDGLPGEDGKSPYIDPTTMTWWIFNHDTSQFEDTFITVDLPETVVENITASQVLFTSTDIQIKYKYVEKINGKYVEKEARVTIPSANPTYAGALSADHYKKLERLPLDTQSVIDQIIESNLSNIGLPDYDEEGVILTFRTNNGIEKVVDIPLQTLSQDMDYDPLTKEIVLYKFDGTEIRIGVEDLVDIYTGSTTQTIHTTVTGNQIYSRIIENSVKLIHLHSEVINTLAKKADLDNNGKVLLNQLPDLLKIGDTETTAGRGDYTKNAYEHSQITDGSNPHGTLPEVQHKHIDQPDSVEITSSYLVPGLDMTVKNTGVYDITCIIEAYGENPTYGNPDVSGSLAILVDELTKPELTTKWGIVRTGNNANSRTTLTYRGVYQLIAGQNITVAITPTLGYTVKVRGQQRIMITRVKDIS